MPKLLDVVRLLDGTEAVIVYVYAAGAYEAEWSKADRHFVETIYDDDILEVSHEAPTDAPPQPGGASG